MSPQSTPLTSHQGTSTSAWLITVSNQDEQGEKIGEELVRILSNFANTCTKLCILLHVHRGGTTSQ